MTYFTTEKTGNLEKLLNWQKTNLLPITIKLDDDISVRTEARLAFRQNSTETPTFSIHALRKKPELERPYFGVIPQIFQKQMYCLLYPNKKRGCHTLLTAPFFSS